VPENFGLEKIVCGLVTWYNGLGRPLCQTTQC